MIAETTRLAVLVSMTGQFQVSAQQKRIERLQRDLDRTAGYGGSDLFSVVLNPSEPGS